LRSARLIGGLAVVSSPVLSVKVHYQREYQQLIENKSVLRVKTAVKDRPELGIWVKEMPKPVVAPDEVLLRLKRASICGSDIGLYEFSAAYAGFARLPQYLDMSSQVKLSKLAHG
jgi:hypothetical protein